MNAQMRLVIMLASVAVSGSLLFAAEEPQAPAGSGAATAQTPSGRNAKTEKPATPEKGTDASQAETDDEEAPPAPGPAAGGAQASPQRFTPSEQVRADFDVSFPIDI